VLLTSIIAAGEHGRTRGGFDRFFREAAEEFKKPNPDFPTLVKIGVKYGIQIEAPPAS
jgi:hypothetical protein